MEPGFKIKKDILTLQKPSGQHFCDFRFRFGSFEPFAFRFSRFFGVPGSGEKFLAAVKIGWGSTPKPVDEIIVGAQGRQGMALASDECGKKPVRFKVGDPFRKGKRSKAHGKEEEKKDKRPEDLWLVECGSAVGWIKRGEKVHGRVGIEKFKLLVGDPELGMEPGSFGRIERSLGMDEKTMVIVHGLPVFDHSAVPPCNSMRTQLNYKGTFDDARVIKSAAQLRDNVNSFQKIKINCFSPIGGNKKRGS